MTPLEAMQRLLRGERVEGLPMRLPPPVASTVVLRGEMAKGR